METKKNPGISLDFTVNYTQQKVTKLEVGERSEVKELIFLHNMTLSQWQLNSHDLLLCSHKDKSSKDMEECFSKENRRLHSQQFL